MRADPGKSERGPNGQRDRLAALCTSLREPLEVIGNLIYLAGHADVDGTRSRRYLLLATERMAEIHEMISSHCRSADSTN